jgi:hypothetical protein
MHRGTWDDRPQRRTRPDDSSLLLGAQPDGTPARARVTLRELPARRPGAWIGGYKVHVLDVVAVIFGSAVLVAIFTRSFTAVVVTFTAGIIVSIVWPR